MSTAPDPTGTAVERAREALEGVDLGDPASALPRLREAQELLTAAIDEAMAGLSENAVGPRLARTRTLAAYQSEEGRVTAAGVERARYDVEQGRHQPLPPGAVPPAPMRFRPRRPTT